MLMRCSVIVSTVFLLSAFCVTAQDAKPAPGNRAAPPEQGAGKETASAGRAGEKGAVAEPAAAPKEEAVPKEPEAPAGDVITFKSGAVLGGIQVVKRSPAVIEIEIIPGVTLSIPRKQVVNVAYDEFEPEQQRADNVTAPRSGEVSVIPGDKLKPEISSRLTQEIPDLPLAYDNEDLLTILDELSQRVGVPIVVDDSVKNLPRKERLWTVEAALGKTLMILLQRDFLARFENLRIVYEYDKLRVTTKKKRASATPNQAAEQANPGAEGPPSK